MQRIPRVRRNPRGRYYLDGFRNGAEAAKVNIDVDAANLLKYAEKDRLGEYAGEIREHQVQMAGDISYDVGRGVTERQYEAWESGFYAGFEGTVNKWLKSRGSSLANRFRRRKNPLSSRETREVVRAARMTTQTARYSAKPVERSYHLGKSVGMASVAEYYGRGKSRKRASRVRMAAGSAASKTLYRGARRNPVTASHPIWKASNLTHKFMSHLDLAQLRIWRDVPLRSVLIGGVEAMGAYKSSVRTVQERMERFAEALQRIEGLRLYRKLLDAPLRAVAGSFGLQEMLRSDF